METPSTTRYIDQRDFKRLGYRVEENFISRTECAQLIEQLKAKQTQHIFPRIERKMPGRSLNYRVMDGVFIQQYLPDLLLIAEKIKATIKPIIPYEIETLKNKAAAVNVNITDPGGEYRWHYDRNAITAILYLNQVRGGETELVPNARKHLGKLKHTFIQRWMDQRLIHDVSEKPSTKIMQITPYPGRLLIMRGDKCLHSVKAVGAGDARYNIIFTFDQKGAHFHVDKNLDPYLYSKEKAPPFDPNYI